MRTSRAHARVSQESSRQKPAQNTEPRGWNLFLFLLAWRNDICSPSSLARLWVADGEPASSTNLRCGGGTCTLYLKDSRERVASNRCRGKGWISCRTESVSMSSICALHGWSGSWKLQWAGGRASSHAVETTAGSLRFRGRDSRTKVSRNTGTKRASIYSERSGTGAVLLVSSQGFLLAICLLECRLLLVVLAVPSRVISVQDFTCSSCYAWESFEVELG